MKELKDVVDQVASLAETQLQSLVASQARLSKIVEEYARKFETTEAKLDSVHAQLQGRLRDPVSLFRVVSYT